MRYTVHVFCRYDTDENSSHCEASISQVDPNVDNTEYDLQWQQTREYLWEYSHEISVMAFAKNAIREFGKRAFPPEPF